jgi:hypothetical protein
VLGVDNGLAARRSTALRLAIPRSAGPAEIASTTVNGYSRTARPSSKGCVGPSRWALMAALFALRVMSGARRLVLIAGEAGLLAGKVLTGSDSRSTTTRE